MNLKSNKITIAYVLLLTIQVPFNIYFFLKTLDLANSQGAEQMKSMLKAALAGYGVIAVIYFLIAGILGVLNIVRSFRLYASGDTEGSIRSMLIVKYGMVPFFLVNFLAMAVLFIAAVMGSRGLILIFGLPVVIVFLLFGMLCTWIAMVPGIFYSEQVLRFAKKDGKISSAGFVWHTILQLCFLTDVLDTMYIAVAKWGKGKKGAVVIGLLYLLVIVYCVLQLIM